jgi:hypothetical protein
MECQPGEEMQVDFGLGAPIEEQGGKTRRSWVLRVVLSYSRKGYSEAVMRQDTETFLRCLENAVRHFGGTPLLLNLDNLKAAVLKADWHDPQINPKPLCAPFQRAHGAGANPHPHRTGQVQPHPWSRGLERSGPLLMPPLDRPRRPAGGRLRAMGASRGGCTRPGGAALHHGALQSCHKALRRRHRRGLQQSAQRRHPAT